MGCLILENYKVEECPGVEKKFTFTLRNYPFTSIIIFVVLNTMLSKSQRSLCTMLFLYLMHVCNVAIILISGFNGDELRPIYLAAISLEEYRSWMSAIETAR